MPNSRTCAKAGAYSCTLSASEEQAESSAHCTTNCGVFSGLLTLTGSAYPNNAALNVVTSDANQLNPEIAPSLQLSCGVHTHELNVRRRSPRYHGSVADHDRRTYRTAKCL